MLPRALTLMLALAAVAAGCVTPPADDIEAATTTEATDVLATAPSTEEVAGDIMLSTATPVRTINNGGAFATVVELTDNITGFVLEVEWTATTPASETLSMWVRAEGVGNVGVPPDPSLVTNTDPPLAQIDGASPLRLALPADLFPEPGAYEIVLRASAEPVGVAANQPYTLYVTTFEDMPFDDAYSALGDHEH